MGRDNAGYLQFKFNNGLLKPRSGKVFFRGKSMERLPAHEVAALGVAYVPEGRKIFPRLTVQENLEMGSFRITNQARMKANMDRVYDLFPRMHERRRQKGGYLEWGRATDASDGKGTDERT